MTSNGFVCAHRQGPVLRLTLQNPPANVLSIELMEALQAELDAARDNGSVHVVVLAAAGKLFSAGHDLKEMTAHRTDADGALEFGLVNRVVPRESLSEAVTECAEIIAAKSPHAVRLGKRAVYEQAGMDLGKAYEQTSRVMVENMLAADAKEGIGAFFE